MTVRTPSDAIHESFGTVEHHARRLVTASGALHGYIIEADDWRAFRSATASAVETAIIERIEAHYCDCGNFDGHPGDCAMWDIARKVTGKIL